MSPISVETFMTVLILAYVIMVAAFIYCQKQGKPFVDSFDKALGWGSGCFVIGYCLNTVAFAYVVWA